MCKKILLATDSFKGCLSSEEVESSLAKTLTRMGHFVSSLPLSDGGDGMLGPFVHALGGSFVHVKAHDPLMRPLDVQYGIAPDGTAVIETALACGLSLLSPSERNPLKTSTYGVGEVLSDALGRGCSRFIVGLGGSGTSDCGMGMLQALTERLGEKGSIDSLPSAPEVSGSEIILASDVRNPLYGPDGAVYVFAPQKGATPQMLPALDERARNFAKKSAESLGYDRSMEPGAGAAGGLGYAFMQFLGAKMRSGADLLLDLSGFDNLSEEADLVITGEGSADAQTLMGKLPERVLQRSQKHGIPVWLIAGKLSDEQNLLDAGFSKVFCINPPGLPQGEAMKPDMAKHNLSRWAKNNL